MDVGALSTVVIASITSAWYTSDKLSALDAKQQAYQKELLEASQKIEANQKEASQTIGANQREANQKMYANQREANQKIDASRQTILDKMEANQQIFLTKLNAMDDLHKEVLATVSCLPRAFFSVATGLREAAAGGPVHALVAASPADCVTWLTAAGFPQYAPMLAPLGGASLLLQTPASLMLAGVAPQHVTPLLEKIIAAAGAPPDTVARDAR